MNIAQYKKDVKTASRSFSGRFSLSGKMLLLTLAIGIAAGGILDGIQTRNLRDILYARQSDRLQQQAEDARVRFDNFVTTYEQSVKMITTQIAFNEYVAHAHWPSRETPVKTYYLEMPPWLPDASALRKFAHVYYALLLDDRGIVREVYQAWPEPLPRSLFKPDNLFRMLSDKQAYMTSIEGHPFVVASETVRAFHSNRNATLMLVSPLNDDFLTTSQGLTNKQNMIALVSGKDNIIFASNKPDELHKGASIEYIRGQYLITGKSFFDSGASDLLVQFTTLISKAEYERLSQALLTTNRQHRVFSVLVLICAFALILFWITSRIKQLTAEVIAFSRETLGISAAALSGGDEMHMLHAQFKRLTAEVISSRDLLIDEQSLLKTMNVKLEQANREIVSSRTKLQSALDTISSLIQQVANEKKLDVRFLNPNLQKCHEIMSCNNKDCLCYGEKAVRCWQIAGTYCLDRPHGTFVEKYDDCSRCPVYRQATTDPIYQIGEYFNNMMHILEIQHKELETAYADLKAAQSQILQQEKMASIGQLAAGVAHEINNPTGFIMSNLGSLQKYADKLTEFIRIQDEAVRELAITLSSPSAGEATPLGQPLIRGERMGSESIIRDLESRRKSLKIDFIIDDLTGLLKESLDGADRIKRIVQDLKNFSRVDEAELKMADINAGLESTINIVWNELKYKATMTKEYGDLPQTKCNPGQLNQVFMNILVNAAHAIEKQGEIRVRTWTGNSAINVAISDTGRGIPPEKIHRIFDPFYTTKGVGEGTGLGLSIAYDIVKKHQGTIEVESEVGKGTTFTVTIPVVEN